MAIINGTQIGADNVSGRDVGILLREKPFLYTYPDGVTRMSYDLAKLCRSPNINKWSKYKPVFYKSSGVTGNKLEAIYGDSGFIMVKEATLNEPGLIDYAIPPEGVNAPHRLGDFRGYDHNAPEPINISPNIVHWVEGNSSGTYSYSITCILPEFIVKLTQEFNNLNSVNMFIKKDGKWQYHTSAPILSNVVTIDDSITYTDIPDLTSIVREYILVFSRYDVAGSGMFDRYIIGKPLTGSVTISAFNGSTNINAHLYNAPDWLSKIMVGNLYTPGNISDGQIAIKLQQDLTRSLTKDEEDLLLWYPLVLYYRDLESSEPYYNIASYGKDDSRRNVSFGLNNIEFILNVQPDSFKVNKYLDVRLTILTE